MILLAEDNQADVYLVQRSLRIQGIDQELKVAEDGEEAMVFIDDAEAGGSVPELALVDLNLPKFSGPEIVRRIRTSPRCAGVPVIVVSSSASQADRDEMTALGISGYFRKPSDFDDFMRLGELARQVLDDHKQPYPSC